MKSVQKAAATCVFALAIAIVRVQVISTREIPLTFSLIVSYGRFGYNSSPSIPAIDLALEHIHNSGVLGEYKLQYSTVKDSECSCTKSLDIFFDEFLLQPDLVKIAIIGCGCSVATEPVAEISHKWNISQISFASAVSTLSDRTRFKNFFRTYPNFENFVPALLSVLNHYGWNRIVFLTQNVNVFNKLFADFQTLLENLKADSTSTCCFGSANITVINRLFSTNADPIPAIVNIFEEDEDFRIFFVNSYSRLARTVICEAAKQNLIYPRYAWITFGWYPDGWWTKAVSKNNVSCSDQQLKDFIEKSKMLQIRQYPTPDDVGGATIAGITPREYDKLYENKSIQLGYTPGLVRGLSYDAVWALALALNKTQEMFLSNYNVTEIGCDELDGGLVPLEQFNYSNGVMGCVIRWNLEQTNFSGVSGWVRFDENGTAFQDRIKLLQYRKYLDGIERIYFGYVDRASGSMLTYKGSESDRTIFPDGAPPDGTPQNTIQTVNLWLVVVYYSLVALGMIFSMVCLVFNFVFRNRSAVQLSSPKLNFFIIAGCLLMYFSAFVQLLYTTNETANHISCILRTWMYVLGYMLAFGTILAKMWRVYQIFHNPTPNKAPKDWQLVLIVMLITSVAIALVLGKTISQIRPLMLIQDNENREGRMALGVRKMNFIWVCYQPGSSAFYCDLFIFLYLGILQIVGLIFAFQTRKVKIPILNDSKYVAALVYISSVVFVTLVLVTFLLKAYINTRNGIFSGGIMLLATIFLILMFVPKMINLYSDPDGKRIFDKNNSVTGWEMATLKRHTTSSAGPTHIQNGSEGEKAMGETEEALKEKDKRISELERELSLIKNQKLNAHN